MPKKSFIMLKVKKFFRMKYKKHIIEVNNV